MKLILRVGLILALTCIFLDSYSQTSVGPNNPSVEGDGSGGSGGVPAWTFGSGTAFSSDNARARNVSLPKGKNSSYLMISGFNFSVPAGSYIAGITVEVEMYGTGPILGSIRENSILLTNGIGARVGNDQSTSALVPYNVADPNTYVTYGGPLNNWGGVLDYTDINSPNFGVALQYSSSNTNFIAFDLYVDHVRVTVTYAPGMTAVANGCFNDGATWGHTSPGIAGIDYPDANVAALIPGGRTVNVCAGTTGNCYALVTNSDASPTTPTFLNLANSTAALNVSTTLLMLTSLVPTADMTSAINMAGGTITIQRNLIMIAARNGGNISRQTVFTNGGTLTVNQDITMVGNVASALTIMDMTATNSVLNVGGDLAIGLGATLVNGTGTAGTINYKGTGSQIIRSAITYFNLTFSGGGPKTLEGDTQVNSTLNMTSGDCDMAGQTLTLGTSAASIGTLSYTAGILSFGTFRRWFNTSPIAEGNVAGLFPVGVSPYYRPFRVFFSTGPSAGGMLSMNHTDPGTGASTVSFVDSPTATPIVRRTNMNWQLAASNGFNIAAGNLNVRIDGTNIGLVGIVTPIVTDLRMTLVGSTIGTAGTNAGTTITPVIRRVSMPAFTNATNTFYVGSINATNSPLPIGLTAFNAQAASDGVQLTWATSTEVDNDFFTIQRSEDGKEFSSIGTVKGSGTTSISHSYALKDRAPLKGISYYRLKQTDYNGTSTLSKIVSVQYDGQITTLMNVYPNPSKGSGITLEITGALNTDQIPVVIYDMLGRVYDTMTLVIDKNSESVSANLTFTKELPGGMYIVKVGQSPTLTSKFMIVN